MEEENRPREKDKFWIIGHKADFNLIIIGENTGPYSEFPNKEHSIEIEGYFHYVKNLVHQIEGGDFSTSVTPAFSRCPYLDDLHENVREPERSFNNLEEVGEYLKKEAESFFVTASLRKYHTEKRTLERFSVEGLKPN